MALSPVVDREETLVVAPTKTVCLKPEARQAVGNYKPPLFPGSAYVENRDENHQQLPSADLSRIVPPRGSKTMPRAFIRRAARV